MSYLNNFLTLVETHDARLFDEFGGPEARIELKRLLKTLDDLYGIIADGDVDAAEKLLQDAKSMIK